MIEPTGTDTHPGVVDGVEPAYAQDDELTLAEAARLFEVSVGTLRRLIGADALPAHRVSGVRGREWRVSTSTLEQSGYARRTTIDLTDEGSELRRLSEALRFERNKVAQLDNELGYALLTIGRLRAKLQAAGIDPDDEMSRTNLNVKPSDDASPFG